MSLILSLLLLLASLLLVAMIWVSGWLSHTPEEIEDAVEEVLESTRVEHMLEELDNRTFESLPRWLIWKRMSWIWRETRILAMASAGLSSSFFLILFALLYGLVWIKSLISPNVQDLRILLGGEMFVLCQVRRDRG